MIPKRRILATLFHVNSKLKYGKTGNLQPKDDDDHANRIQSPRLYRIVIRKIAHFDGSLLARTDVMFLGFDNSNNSEMTGRRHCREGARR